jgi:ubiquinone/menaquinone biosynthesis C-methylase UbiE
MGACNLCGETRWQTLEEAGGTQVVRCSCGLVFLWPQPPRSSLKQAYGAAYYRPWEDQAHLRQFIWRKRMARVATLAPPGKLLDVGCGTGTFLLLAKRHGWEVAGTELSHAGAEAARAEELTVREGEIWEAEFPTASFDVVTCWHVIEHVGDPRRVVQEMHRVLHPGGWLVLATPNLEDRIFRAAYRLARGRRPRLYEPGEREIHLFFFSAATLRQLVTSAGFTDVTIGFDRGAAAQWGKRLVNEVAYCWFRVMGLNWGMALALIARKPPGPQVKTDG